MTRPVTVGALAERDIKEARAWFDAREPGLGDQFLERVNETVRLIAATPEIYRIVFSDARRAPVKAFKILRLVPHRVRFLNRGGLHIRSS